MVKDIRLGDTQTVKMYKGEDLVWQRKQSAKLYGFRVLNTEADPSLRVEYLFDASGMNPARMNYSTGTFDYGDWNDVWFVRDNFPAMVRSNGTVAYRLNPNDYSKKDDGSASDVSDPSFDGNAMSAIPLCWVKRYTEGDYRYVIFSDTQVDDTFHAYAHTRPDGSISAFAYGPMFEGCIISGKLRSISGYKPHGNMDATAIKNAAKANSNRWGLRTWMFDELVADLLVMIGKSTNFQEIFGQGHTTGTKSESNFIDTGTLGTKGQFYGYSNTINQVKVFHMEALWGDRWEWEEGLVGINGKFYVKKTPENGGYNFDGIGYDDTGILWPTTTSYSWVSSMICTEYGTFPSAFGGSENTFECDFFYQSKSSTVTVPRRGDYGSQGDCCGRTLAIGSGPSARWYLGGSPFLIDPV